MKKVIFVFFMLTALFLNLFGNGGGEETGNLKQNAATLRLIYLEGDVKVNGQRGEIDQKIPVGSSLETGKDSYCEVLFGGKNIIKIQEETITTLNIGQGQGNVVMEKGSMAFLLEKLDVLGLGNRDFELITPLTTAGIRGTAFFVKVESTDSVYFCNCNGITNLTDVNGNNKIQLKAEQHRAVRYIKAAGEISQSSGKLLYHSSEEMDELAVKINHKIPWGSIGSSY